MLDIYMCFVVYGDNGAMILDSWDDCFEVLKYVKNSKYEGFLMKMKHLNFYQQ